MRAIVVARRRGAGSATGRQSFTAECRAHCWRRQKFGRMKQKLVSPLLSMDGALTCRGKCAKCQCPRQKFEFQMIPTEFLSSPRPSRKCCSIREMLSCNACKGGSCKERNCAGTAPGPSSREVWRSQLPYSRHACVLLATVGKQPVRKRRVHVHNLTTHCQRRRTKGAPAVRRPRLGATAGSALLERAGESADGSQAPAQPASRGTVALAPDGLAADPATASSLCTSCIS